MNEPFSNIDLFQAYLNEELEPANKQAFEDQLKTNPDFEKEFSIYKSGIQTIKNEGFRTEVNSFMEQKSDKQHQKTRRLWIGGVAASLILVATFSYLQWSENPFDKYYEPYPNILSTRGNSIDFKGLEAYTDGNYENAVSYFNQVKFPSDTLLLYMGVASIELEQFPQAINSLKQIPSNSIFYPQSNWYLGLIYLRLNQPIFAKSHLSEIKQGKFKYKEAQAILKRDLRRK